MGKYDDLAGVMRIPGLSLGLLCLGALARICGLSFVSKDATLFLIPWYADLSRSGFAMLGTDFANYSPPYLYLLWLASLVFGPNHPLLAIKCVSIAGDIGLCFVVALLVERCSSSAVPFLRAFALVWCLPTVVLNSSVWGQCDAMYAAFAIGSLVAAYSRPTLALGLFGVAVSIKLQAMFIAPAIALLFLTRRLPWMSLPIAGFSALALLVPAALAGRSWPNLITTYVRQFNTYRFVSMSAPNLWEGLSRLFWKLGRYQALITHYDVLVAVGMGATVVGGMIYLVLGAQRLARQNGRTILELAFVAAFLFPFMLPKMLDRYFFLADVLSAALAIVDRGWLRVAALVQIGSLSAYAPALLDVKWPLNIGVAGNLLVLVILVLRWYPPAQQALPATTRKLFMSVSPA